MTSAEEFAALYGPAARYSEYTIGDVISFNDPGQVSGRNKGPVLYVAAAIATEGLRYIVSPNIGIFPVEIAANEVISD